MEQKIRNGIQSYLTPMLICIVGYLLNDKISSVDKRLERLEVTQDQLIRVEQRMVEVERRIGNIEQITLNKIPAKHEEFITLKKTVI